MATWEDVICKARELADAAGRKVADVAEVTKHKLKIAENERDIRDAYEAIGRLIYDSGKLDTVPDAEKVASLTRQLDDLYIENDHLRSEVDHFCGRTTCRCGASNPQGAAYCNACGKSL